MFFKNWETIGQIIIMSVLVYIGIVAIVRISGKRTLSELNAFDFIVTVTIGSISATTILSVKTTLVDGIVAIGSLVALQYIVAKLDVHLKFVNKVLKSDPTLLYHNGSYLEKNMKKMRITHQDILQEVRLVGGTVMENVTAVILESNGKLSVISDISQESSEKLRDYR